MTVSNKKMHRHVMKTLLAELNKSEGDSFVLKGGTALMLCYGLDRFSEDIDLDSSNRKDILPFIEEFCAKYHYSYRVAKNTETVKRCILNYHSGNLKVEVSYRPINSQSRCCSINGVTVYDIDTLCTFKTNAYQNRDKIRDLYDLCFIGEKYFDRLKESTVFVLTDALWSKGLEQFDYMVSTQPDPLIDQDELAVKFLKLYEKLGLLGEKSASGTGKENG